MLRNKLWAEEFKKEYGFYPISGGGGEKPQPAQVIQMPAQPPAPGAGETAADVYRARIQYDPQIAALEYAMAQQYAPQYGQLFAQTAERQFPGIGGLTETGISQAQQRFESPFGYTPEELETLAAIRGRQRGQIARNIREEANVGGGLYGGRRELREDRALSELEQAFGAEDIGRRLQGGLYAQQQAIPYLQMLYPQIQQTPAVSQSAVPNADALYAAMAQASQRQYALQPAMAGSPSPLYGLAGQLGGGLLGGWASGWGKK